MPAQICARAQPNTTQESSNKAGGPEQRQAIPFLLSRPRSTTLTLCVSLAFLSVRRRLGDRHRHRPTAGPSPVPSFPCGSDDRANGAPLRHLFVGDGPPPGMPAPFFPLPSFPKPSTPSPKLFEPGSDPVTSSIYMIPTSFEFCKKSSGAHIVGSLMSCVHPCCCC